MNVVNSVIVPDPKEQESAMYFDENDEYGEIPNPTLYRALVLEEDGKYGMPMISFRSMMRVVGGWLRKVYEMDNYLFFAGDMSTYLKGSNFYLPQFYGTIIVLRMPDNVEDDFAAMEMSDAEYVIGKLMDMALSFEDESDETVGYDDTEEFEMED